MEHTRDALEAINEGLRAALVDVAQKHGRLMAKSAAKGDVERLRDELGRAEFECERLRRLVKDMDERITEADARTAKAAADAKAARSAHYADHKDRDAAHSARVEAQARATKAEGEANALRANWEACTVTWQRDIQAVKAERDSARAQAAAYRAALAEHGIPIPGEGGA